MATGTVRKRGDKWQYIINLPFDPSKGVYPQIRKSGFERKKDAQDALRAALALIDASEGKASPALLLKDYLDEWLSSLNNKPRTVETYQYTCEIIKKYIGDVTLGDLTHVQIEAMYHSLETQGKAASSVHRVHRVLRAALNRAVRRGIITTSPMRRVDAPKGGSERRHTLSVEQVFTLLDWLKDRHPISYVGVYLAAYTGLRRGEICGLTWGDCDLDAAVVRVVQARQRRPKQGTDIVDKPKTVGSVRSVPLAPDLVTILREWRDEHAKVSDYVLVNAAGEPIDPATLARDMRKAVKALSLPPVSFHDLRHTHATLLLQGGTPLKVVAERLGHTSIRMTADTYSHVTQNMQQEATERIAGILKRQSELS